MPSAAVSTGVQPWVFAVTVLSILLGFALVYFAYRWWRRSRNRRVHFQDNRRTQYYELERRGEDPRGSGRHVRGGIVGPPAGFAASSGVSPITPGPVWSRAAGDY